MANIFIRQYSYYVLLPDILIPHPVIMWIFLKKKTNRGWGRLLVAP
jgi:hypothetical protein